MTKSGMFCFRCHVALGLLLLQIARGTVDSDNLSKVPDPIQAQMVEDTTAEASLSSQIAQAMDQEAADEEKLVHDEAKVQEDKAEVAKLRANETGQPVDPSFLIPTPPATSNLYYFRWLWWILIAYMFYGQATVCDDYFVPAIEVIVETYRIPQDVAGATLMALGCNGPELFTNVVALFITHSDVGVGTIVGSEVFNLLLIIGGSILASPRLPLKLETVPFLRDCAFYLLSVVLLTWVLWNGKVTFLESCILLACAALYGVTVASTARICEKFGWVSSADQGSRTNNLLDTDEEVVFEGAVVDIESHPLFGSAIPVRILPPDGSKGEEQATMRASKHALYIMQQQQQPRSAQNVGLEEPLLSDFTMPMGDGKFFKAVGAKNEAANGKMKNAAATRMVPFAYIPYVIQNEEKCLLKATMDCGHVLEFSVSSEKTREILLHCLAEAARRRCRAVESQEQPFRFTPQEACLSNSASARNVLPESSVPSALELAGRPIVCVLAATMSWCDPKNPETKNNWLAAFLIAMAWLALFSYAMVVSADYINIQFGITQAVLGVTLLAGGTSFPNLWASLLTAKQGNSSMAVANALGSNVQNVFLALALPWVVKTGFADGGYINMATPGIMDGVFWMGMTWLLLVILAVACRFQLGAWVGYTFFGLYFVYLWDACFWHSS